jgi:TolA-binding protein
MEETSMKSAPAAQFMRLGAIACAALATLGTARADEPADPANDAEPARLEALQRQVNEQSARLEQMRRTMAQEEASLNDVKRALGLQVLASQRARGVAPDTATAQAAPDANAPKPVGQAPETAPPAVAPIFEQPGVLTPKGKVVIEPSFQYS